MSFNSRLKSTKITGQREFQSLDVRGKKLLTKTSLQYLGMVTEKSCNQNNKQTSLEKTKVEPVEPVLKNIYQSNTYRKDLSWPHFNNEPRVLEKQHVKDQQSCIFLVLQFQVATRGNNIILQNTFLYQEYMKQ